MVLTEQQVAQFHNDGFVLVENAVSAEQLQALQHDFAAWVDESRQHTDAYGAICDGRPRFDMQPGHTAEVPALRRVSSPQEVSATYLQVMRNNRALDALTQLYGPNLKFNNAKINSKLPGTATEVKYHQDFLFEPHTNTDLATVLIFLDDIDENNGPLEVVPGSHKGPLYEHWHDGEFTGAIAPELVEDLACKAVIATGKAGIACIMHTLTLHGSAVNRSTNSRTVYIVEYAAEDAMPLIVNHIPSEQEGEVVRGIKTGRIRSVPFNMAEPAYPTATSFFNQQEGSDRTVG